MILVHRIFYFGVALLLALAVSACSKRGRGEPCDKNADCEEGLICLVYCVRPDLFDRDGLVQEYQDEQNRKTRCKGNSPPCALHGRCTWKKGKGCIATSDEICSKTIWCKQQGRCRAVDGRCRK